LPQNARVCPAAAPQSVEETMGRGDRAAARRRQIGVVVGFALLSALSAAPSASARGGAARQVPEAGDKASVGKLAPATEVAAAKFRRARRRALRGAALAETCQLPTGLSPLSTCLADNRSAIIGPNRKCKSAFVDKAFTGATALGGILIESGGSLYIADKTVAIETTGIRVQGLFQAGTETCPIGKSNIRNRVTITFTGGRPCPSPTECPDFTKGIQVESGGSLKMFGIKGVPTGGVSWSHLSDAAGPVDKYGEDTGTAKPVPTGGDATIQITKKVHDGPGAWEADDWIVIGGTSFSPFESEFVQIAMLGSNGTGGTEIKLKQKLKHYHFGGKDPGDPSLRNFNAGRELNYGVDERAEVGLITRNIKLTGRIEPGENNIHWGGELKFLAGFKEVSLQGVEIEKFGKDQLGSYPVHFHIDGDVAKQRPLVNANSVHHSFNKCVTVHSTQNVTIQNMVCARIVGHIFYQEIGNESGVHFLSNLGLGAMSNFFDINASSPELRNTLISKFWWTGDNLANAPGFGYVGFRVPNTDAQNNPTHGGCMGPRDDGGLVLLNPVPPCAAGQWYTEPASGFWIINPGTELVGNSIGGCQGAGRGIWWVPPSCAGTFCGSDPSIKSLLMNLKFEPLGKIKNNRVHGCFAGLYDEPEGVIASTEQLFPHQKPSGGIQPADEPPIIANFEAMTVTRNRGRGIWMRPSWMNFQHARVATNRINVTLVSSGGLEGNAPGVWAMLKDSVVVGLSTNNVDRFGPCPSETAADQSIINGVGGNAGCIDMTPGPLHRLPVADIKGADNLGDNSGGGYPTPFWNSFGYMIYDGPVRIFDNRFVNFYKDIKPHLTKSDQTFFTQFAASHKFPATDQDFIYEGDAVFGWFDSNQSAYPTSSASRGLKFDNAELRHQIFTEKVNRAEFNDGDKNTAIIDKDGTLTGYNAVDSTLNKVEGLEPISLNNLPINGSSNSVDECRAEGGQDEFFEGRPTSLISPGSMATLEFGALYPIVPTPNVPENQQPPDLFKNHTQIITFTKDSTDFGAHQSMSLHSRDRRGLWEPKVTSGFGYTVAACASKEPFDRPTDVSCDPVKNFPDTGIPKYVSVGLTDPVKPGIDFSDPSTAFFVRLGICYADKDGNHPANANLFKISRGYKSWGGGNVTNNAQNPKLALFWNNLENRFNGEICRQLDQLDPRDLCPDGQFCPDTSIKGCPAHGVTALPPGGCPVPSEEMTVGSEKLCIYPKTDLTAAASVSDLFADGAPVVDKYFYDAAKGMLFLNIVQDIPNAFGPSPLGSCTGERKEDPACPDVKNGESYYGCPAAGCIHYVIELEDENWKPGRTMGNDGNSVCEPYPTYAQEPPANQNVLVEAGTTTKVMQMAEGGKDGMFPHNAPVSEPVCPATTE
jgi:hypothetical protein